MRYIEDFVEARQKAWCIHCGAAISNVSTSRDHVPTKSLLSEALRELGSSYDKDVFTQKGWEYERIEKYPDGYLPQVLICQECNADFSEDENYLLCVLHAVMAGSLYPDKSRFPEASKVLRSNRHVVRALKAEPNGQLRLFENLQPFVVSVDDDRVKNVILKNARGLAYHEIGEPLMSSPKQISFFPLHRLTTQQRNDFEAIGTGVDVWPEVGSRIMLAVAENHSFAGGWIEVEEARYRYAINWTRGVTVRTVIWEYLATETHWAELR